MAYTVHPQEEAVDVVELIVPQGGEDIVELDEDGFEGEEAGEGHAGSSIAGNGPCPILSREANRQSSALGRRATPRSWCLSGQARDPAVLEVGAPRPITAS